MLVSTCVPVKRCCGSSKYGANFVMLSRNHHHIRGLGARLKLISFNFCLSPAKFGELMQLGQNEFFHDLVGKWFTLLRNNKNSTVVNGLEFLAGLTISTRSGKFDEKVCGHPEYCERII